MPFEVYKPRGERVPKQAIVTLSKNSIVFNKIAREKLNTSSIEMAYDKDANLIRVKPSEDGLNIKKTKVFAKGFFKHFNVAKKGRFAAEFKEDALYIDLNKSLP